MPFMSVVFKQSELLTSKQARRTEVAAYFICTMSIHDPDTYRRYTALTPATLARYGGRFLTRGNPVLTVEGPAFTQRLVLIEFPDGDAALAW